MIKNRRRSVKVRIISNKGFVNISYMIQNRRRSVEMRIISNERFANMIQNRRRSIKMRIISNDKRVNSYTIQNRYIKTKESKKIRQKKRKEKLTYAYILTPNCTGYIVRVLFAIIRQTLPANSLVILYVIPLPSLSLSLSLVTSIITLYARISFSFSQRNYVTASYDVTLFSSIKEN